MKISWIASRSRQQLVVAHDAPLDRLAAHLPASMPPPSSTRVITTWFDSCAAESRMVPVGGLPRASAHRRRLDAVVHGVADQVHERLADLVDHGLVDARLLALQHQLDLLALAVGEVADEAREALEDVADGQHPHVHDRLLQLGRDAGHLVHGLEQLRAERGRGGGDLAAQLHQLGAVHDQLADQVQQVVELGEVDAHHARTRARRGVRPPAAERPCLASACASPGSAPSAASTIGAGTVAAGAAAVAVPAADGWRQAPQRSLEQPFQRVLRGLPASSARGWSCRRSRPPRAARRRPAAACRGRPHRASGRRRGHGPAPPRAGARSP